MPDKKTPQEDPNKSDNNKKEDQKKNGNNEGENQEDQKNKSDNNDKIEKLKQEIKDRDNEIKALRGSVSGKDSKINSISEKMEEKLKELEKKLNTAEATAVVKEKLLNAEIPEEIKNILKSDNDITPDNFDAKVEKYQDAYNSGLNKRKESLRNNLKSPISSEDFDKNKTSIGEANSIDELQKILKNNI